MKKISKRLFPILKTAWIVLACFFIFFAILFTSFRALTPLAKQYKVDVEKKLSSILGQTVHIQTMETSWYWFEPVLKLEKISIEGINHHALRIDKLLVGIDVFQSVAHWQIQPGVLHIQDVSLDIHQNENGWDINGVEFQTKNAIDFDALKPALAWIFAQEKITVKNVHALIHLKDGTILPLKNLQVIANHHHNLLDIEGKVALDQTTKTNMSFMAHLTLNDYNLETLDGEIFISLANFLPAQWQGLLPTRQSHVSGGVGDVQIWVDITKGKLALIQSLAQFKHLMLHLSDKQNLFIKKFGANLAYQPSDKGWQISADHIELTTDGKTWPTNKFLIRKNNALNSLSLYFDSLNVSILKKLSVDWPEQVRQLIHADPFGYLKKTQLHIQNGHVELMLSQFDEIGFRGDKAIPGMSGLSGFLSWQPDEGQLQINTDALLIQPEKQTDILFSKLDVLLTWKKISDRLRVNLDHFVLEKKGFVVTANGRVDDATSSNKSITLESLFTIDEVQTWFSYIPEGVLKPKLDRWVKHDIHKIERFSGQVNLDGKLSDFPFDHDEGKFLIKGYLENAHFKFKDGWPDAEQIYTYLELDKRNLDLDLVGGEVLDIQLEQADLKINDIGHDKETLLFRTQNTNLSEKIVNLIRHSPLKKRLSKLNMLEVMGPVSVDLMLEIPLYSENDKTLVQGALNFLNAQAILKQEKFNLSFKKMNGSLSFDEQGVIKSSLQSELFGQLFDFDIRSARGQNPYIEMVFKGQASVEMLKKRFNHTALKLLEGYLPIAGKIKMTDKSDDLDSLKFESDLKGLSINLPPPFGKTAQDKKPITINLGYHPDKLMDVKLAYQDALAAKLYFNTKSNRFIKGNIRIGQDVVAQTINSGVLIVGTFKQFDWEQWHKTIKLIQSDTASETDFLSDIRDIDLEFEYANFSGLKLNNLILKIKREDEKGWGLKLKHTALLADLYYQPTTHLLSGHFDKLNLDSFLKGSNKNRSSTLKPSQIPNLNLTIDDVSYKNMLLGDVIIRGYAKTGHWQLEYLKLINPAYQLSLNGLWEMKGKVHHTKLKARMLIHKLSDALKQLHIEPVVEARQGEVNFKGGWNGSIFQASLEKLYGNMDIKLKNGRITKLNPETEEKLGLGKLLSILSLQTIPRRLSLDFSDLSKSGYSFDIFKGKYQIKNGVMSTDDSYIDGPVAYASIKGRLDLKNRLYDLNLHVSPHITASLPIVATIAGGPVAGVAAWVANKLINHGMQKISGYTYKISGPWLKPVVQQVSIIKKQAPD